MNANPKRLGPEASERETDLPGVAKRLAKDPRVLARVKASEADIRNRRLLTTEEVFDLCEKA